MYTCLILVTISLEPIRHRDKICIVIRAKLTGMLYKAVQKFPGRLYSNTHKSFYVVYSEENLRNLEAALKLYDRVTLLPFPTAAAQRPSIAVPRCYTDKLIRMRYSGATYVNYVTQFRKILEHVYTKPYSGINPIKLRCFYRIA